MKKLFASILFLLPVLVFAQKELTLSDAVMQQYRAFYPKHTFGFSWIPGTADYAFLAGDYQSLKRGNIKNEETSTIITAEELATACKDKFAYVNVVEWTDATHFIAHGETGYHLVDIEKKTAHTYVHVTPEAENINFNYASGFAAFTIKNALYILRQGNAFEAVDEDPRFVNGQAIARSEFGITNGIFWSNSGKYLGYYRKDESKVADYPLLDINTPTGSLKSIKYPMAGQSSELSGAGIHNVETGKTVYLKPQGNSEDYITNFGFSADDKYVLIAEVNRDQNHMKLQQYDAETGAFVKTILEEKNDKWVEPEHPAYFINNNEFIWLSEKDGFMNLYLYNLDGTLIKQLTSNKWVAQDILGHDDKYVYFVGTGEIPTEKHAFKVDLKKGKQTQLTTETGTHEVTFNSDFTLFFDSYSSTDVPNIEIIRDNAGKELREVLKAKNPLAEYKMGKAEYGTIKAADNVTDLYYRMIKPSNFDASKKYPVLIYVYGGPHAQMVRNEWYGGASLWMHWMAEQGYIVYTVDNRGSANRGFAFESVIHRHLGDAEMADQMEGVQFLRQQPFVDGKRIAVHGWSFGGFMTTSLMLRYPEEFTTGVAGGPVTDWAYYEVMYGERYMDRPEQNKEGYEKARLMNYADQLKGSLLLIHGTVDDVVVMQHNLALVKAFVDAGIQMDFFPYPMHPHNVRGKDRVHLMEKVLTYIINNNQ